MKEIINKIIDVLTSPTRMALFAIIGTSCFAFLHGKLEPKDFLLIAGNVLSFYFGQHIPGSGGASSTTSVTSRSTTPSPDVATPAPTADETNGK